MNRLFRPTILAALAVFGAGTLASGTASANVELGGTAGVHVFSDTNELGVADTADATSQRNSAMFGLRLGIFFNDFIGVEGEFGVIPSEPRDAVHDLWNLVYRASAVLQFRADRAENRMVPFLLFGGGGMSLVDNDDAGDALIKKDTDGMLHAGIGVKYRVEGGWGLRADARIYFPPSSKGTDDFTTDFELLLSIYKEWGRKPFPKSDAVVAVVVVDDDPDHDGIKGVAGCTDCPDKCPTETEDQDGFEDDNGCPDPDNDGDGIADLSDKCPNVAEDKDGFEDENGCPDFDNDADGVVDYPDANDKCPVDPEDRDGFEDDNGCPELDNDGDGVADAVDRKGDRDCKNDPETKNGYEDSDGCPDVIPDKVKKFSGSIQGINFRVNMADLLPASFKVLDQAVAVLKEFPEIKLEIQGHTDDQVFKAKKTAKYQDNSQLSQGRADTVMAYLIKKGIDASRLSAKGYGDTTPVIDPKGLKGAKLNAARIKNRRVEFKLVTAP